MRIGNSFDHSQIYNDPYALKIRESLAAKQADNVQEDKNATPQEAVKVPGSADENSVRRERLLGLEDISLTFNAKDDFDLIGKTSDITDLDLEKAVSFAKKDDILTQYRNTENSLPVYSGEDGLVIAK